jgi:hypothetical protein
MPTGRYIRKLSDLEIRYGDEIVRMYCQKRNGSALIALSLGITKKFCENVLKRKGVYKTVKIPRRGGIPPIKHPSGYTQDELKEMNADFNREWRGVVDDYTGMYFQLLKNRKAASAASIRRYRAMTNEQRREYNRAMVERQGEKRKQNTRAWRTSQRGKDWSNSYQSQRKKDDPSWRIRCSVAGRIHEAIKGNYSAKTEKSEYYVGCSWAELRAHLERQFKRWMTWENYGSKWHIDHIIPCASFDFTKDDQLRACFHFTNLQPLEAVANMLKGARFTAVQPQLMLAA